MRGIAEGEVESGEDPPLAEDPFRRVKTRDSRNAFRKNMTPPGGWISGNPGVEGAFSLTILENLGLVDESIGEELEEDFNAADCSTRVLSSCF